MMLFALTLIAAPQDAAVAPSPSVPAVPAVETPICRREVPTGSNFPVKTCHTKTEWRAIDRQNDANTETYSRTRSRR